MSIFLDESKNAKAPDTERLIEGMYPSVMVLYNQIIKEKQPTKAKISAAFIKIEKIIKERKGQAKTVDNKKNWKNAVNKFHKFITNVLKEGKLLETEKKTSLKSEYEIRGSSKYPEALGVALKKHYAFLEDMKNSKD